MKIMRDYILFFTKIALACAVLFSCSSQNDKDLANPTNSDTTQTEVSDINVVSTTLIPNSNVYMTNYETWSSAITNDSLIFTSNSSSTITAQKSQIKHILSPNQIGLEKYLEEKFPGRDYQYIEINGLIGVRAEVESTKNKTEADIYLISELKDFIHITSCINNPSEDMASADKILSTVRLIYKGKAPQAAASKTETVQNSLFHYSFDQECFVGQHTSCKPEGAWTWFSLSASEATIEITNKSSAIILVGSDEGKLYDNIIAEGEYLVTNNRRILTSSLVGSQTLGNSKNIIQKVKIKENFVYIIRSVQWPFEDLVLKLKINSVSENSISFSYQKLLSLDKKSLRQQNTILNKNIIDNEMSEGEVLIDLHQDSGFSFKHFTTGENNLLKSSCDFKIANDYFELCNDNSEISEIFRMNNTELAEVSKADFPDTRTYLTRSKAPSSDLMTDLNWKNNDLQINIGQIYGIYSHHSNAESGSVYAALQVLDIDQDKKWIRLKFRLFSSGKADQFQKWASVQEDLIEFEELLTYQDRFLYPGGGVANQGNGLFFDNVNDMLKIESNPYGNQRGFYNFGNVSDTTKISKQDIESKTGQFVTQLDIKTGDVVGVYMENYFYKNIFLMIITDHHRGEFVKFATKYFYSAKAQYEGLE